MLPFKGKTRLTSAFGMRVLNGQTVNHKGVDLVGDDSPDIYAVLGGTVQQSTIVTDKSNLTWQWGHYVCVKADDGNLHYYCHMASRAVKTGDIIKQGDKVGVMGNTGYSFGAHLHFEIRNASRTSIDPTPTLGIANKTGTYTGAPTNQAAPAPTGTPASGKLKVFGVAKGINVQAFTNCDVNNIAQDNGADIRIADGEYPLISLHGDAGGFSWCLINYNGTNLFMPYNGLVQDRCTLELQ